ncbi:MAG: hypothetical protein WC661_02945 [Opitutaceae bacterium]|jgi:hypothetical protein
MNKVACHYCGLPFKALRVQPGREYFCCSGCAIASRVPVDADGKFPTNPALLTALAVGFIFFNQLIFWLLAVLLVREGRVPVAGRFEVASLVLGTVTWLALVVVQWRLGARRWVDAVVAVLTAGLLASGLASGSQACAAAANAALVAWSVRGFLRKKS